MPTIIYDEFEWDDNKNLLNQQKHLISFEAAVEIFNGLVVEFPAKNIKGELRQVAIGILENTNQIVVVFTKRARRKRIISARRASKNEKRIYKEFCNKEKH